MNIWFGGTSDSQDVERERRTGGCWPTLFPIDYVHSRAAVSSSGENRLAANGELSFLKKKKCSLPRGAQESEADRFTASGFTRLHRKGEKPEMTDAREDGRFWRIDMVSGERHGAFAMGDRSEELLEYLLECLRRRCDFVVSYWDTLDDAHNPEKAIRSQLHEIVWKREVKQKEEEEEEAAKDAWEEIPDDMRD